MAHLPHDHICIWGDEINYLSEIIDRYRAKHMLSKSAMAEKLGLDGTNFMWIEACSTRIHIQTMQKILELAEDVEVDKV